MANIANISAKLTLNAGDWVAGIESSQARLDSFEKRVKSMDTAKLAATSVAIPVDTAALARARTMAEELREGIQSRGAKLAGSQVPAASTGFFATVRDTAARWKQAISSNALVTGGKAFAGAVGGVLDKITNLPLLSTFKEGFQAMNAGYDRFLSGYGKMATPIKLSGSALDLALTAMGKIIPGISILGSVPAMLAADLVKVARGQKPILIPVIFTGVKAGVGMLWNMTKGLGRGLSMALGGGMGASGLGMAFGQVGFLAQSALQSVQGLVSAIPLIGPALGGVVGAVGGILGTAAMIGSTVFGWVTKALPEVTEIGQMARTFGIETERMGGLIAWAGGDVELLEKSFIHLGRRLGEIRTDLQLTGAAASEMRTFGLDPAALSTMSMDQALIAISNRMRELPTATERISLGFSLFSRHAARIIGPLERGGADLERWIRIAKQSGASFSDVDFLNAKEAKRSLQELQLAWTGFQRQVAIQTAPYVKAIADWLNESVLSQTNIGELAGGMVEMLVSGFLNAVDAVEKIVDGLRSASGFFARWLGLTGQTSGAEWLGNFLTGGAANAGGNAIGDALGNALHGQAPGETFVPGFFNAAQVFAQGGQFANQVGTGLSEAADQFAQTMIGSGVDFHHAIAAAAMTFGENIPRATQNALGMVTNATNAALPNTLAGWRQKILDFIKEIKDRAKLESAARAIRGSPAAVIALGGAGLAPLGMGGQGPGLAQSKMLEDMVKLVDAIPVNQLQHRMFELREMLRLGLPVDVFQAQANAAKEAFFSALGVDLKSPVDTFVNALDQLRQAWERNTISSREFSAAASAARANMLQGLGIEGPASQLAQFERHLLQMGRAFNVRDAFRAQEAVVADLADRVRILGGAQNNVNQQGGRALAAERQRLELLRQQVLTAEELRRAGEAGIRNLLGIQANPLEQFQNRVADLEQIQARAWDALRNDMLGAMTAWDEEAMAWIEQQGMRLEAGLDQAMAEAMDQLEKATGIERKAPEALMEGTREAMSAIARHQRGPSENPAIRLNQLIEEQTRILQDQRAEQARIRQAIERNRPQQVQQANF